MNKEELLRQFIEIYGGTDTGTRMFFSPGRVNLIGEHTDYNGGYVLPYALKCGTYLLARPNNHGLLRFTTANFRGNLELSIEDEISIQKPDWVNYPLGVLKMLREERYFDLGGMDLYYFGNIPPAAGLSSSASIELVTAIAFNTFFQLGFSDKELALLSQKAENTFVGMNCGIMDQFAVALSGNSEALFLDCSSREYKSISLKNDTVDFVVIYSGKGRKLTASKYNERVEECATALKMINKHYSKNFSDLSSVPFELFKEYSGLMKDNLFIKRARHVIDENVRVIRSVDAIERKQYEKLAYLMRLSHTSLKNDYEVSGVELDSLVSLAQSSEAVLGARMTGAGFGGCTINIVKKGYKDMLKAHLLPRYKSLTGLTAEFIDGSPGRGAGEIDIRKHESYN